MVARGWWHSLPKPWAAGVLGASLLLSGIIGGCGGGTSPGDRDSATHVARVLAKVLGVTAPRWSGKVLAGPPCGEHANHFCPIYITATPDGKLIALADARGRLEVAQTATGKIVLSKTLPKLPNKATATGGVWISPNGQLVSEYIQGIFSTGVTIINEFGIWDVATGRTMAEASKFQVPIQNVAFGPGHSAVVALNEPSGGLLALASVEAGSSRFSQEVKVPDQPDEVVYSRSQSAWIAMWRDGYALWKPGTRGRSVKRPECLFSNSSAMDSEGAQFACDAGARSSLKGSRLVKVWDIPAGTVSSQISTGKYGLVRTITFLDNGSIALTAGADTYDSTHKTLLVVSLRPRPVIQKVTALPGVSAGWDLLALGKYVAALGDSVRGGYCCIAVEPAS
jgi:hypothetical protein